MNTIQKLKESFAYFKASQKTALTFKEPFYWIVKLDGLQGVAIEIPADKQVNEQFASMKYYTQTYFINGEEHHLLMLMSNRETLVDEFTFICASFLEKVLDAETFQQINENPLTWWHTMKELVGNVNVEKEAYSVLGEMLGYYCVLKINKEAKWNGPDRASLDIETGSKGYEVKSTLSRYGAEITINSQYQLNANSLLFFRFEPSKQGLSIEDMVNKLVEIGVEEEYLNNILEKLQYKAGSEIRLKTYMLLEALEFEIDEDFPKITLDTFKDGKLPPSITGLTYTIDLTGLVGKTIDLEGIY